MPRRLKLPPLSFPTEWLPVCLLLIACGLMWAFIELADEVAEGEVNALDRKIVLAMRNADDLADPIGPPWFEEMGRDLTALGGVVVLTMLTLSVAIFVGTLSSRHTAAVILIAVLGAVVISSVLKAVFSRPRPELVPHESFVYSHSFPSGHAMMSAAVYLTLGMLTARLVARRRLKVLAIALAVTITLAVGVSRVYLGVHWPSDVLAGWALGAAWALTCWVVAWWLQQRGQMESRIDADGPS